MMFGLVIAVMLCVLSGCAVSQTAARTKTHVVVIRHMEFVPSDLQVSAGDTIIWKNEDMVPHTATSEQGSAPSKDASPFDSKEIKAGADWTYVPHRQGSCAYICAYHPTMKGVLIVR